ncbi:hypothetical protein K432DRAFT_414214 [Lepidopterella palustris CBS 459.81]|uniref:Nucleolar protein 12 n=1 Tax=Lepidopterella palustris CBS 459.81 TaxID=1314670 RepID=A0A8E2EHY8_9PEZI|nr:hypothetical protein K432DRAFT_414214 [Lepidopterella palustris CBS 459.81]
MAPPTKRRKTSATTEIVFDPAAREEYLTGFHKRKLARIKHAQDEAVKKDREERVQQRRELRQQRKDDLERHVQEVNDLLKANGDFIEGGDSTDDGVEEDDWEGFEEGQADINREEEYIDGDKYMTVTVETVSITRDGFSKPEGEKSEEGSDNEARLKAQDAKKRAWTKETPKKVRPKKKKTKFRYESKADRKVTRLKERSKNKEQAKARRG